VVDASASVWAPDPTGRFSQRYWSDSAWTEWVAGPGGGGASRDPLRPDDPLVPPGTAAKPQAAEATPAAAGAPRPPRQTDTSDLVVPGLADYAARAGWQPLGPQPFPSPFDRFVSGFSLLFVHEGGTGGAQNPVSGTSYHSAYGGDVDGSAFTVANAFTARWRGSRVSAAQFWFPVICGVEVTPRRHALPRFGGFTTGDAAFDGQFTVETRDKELAHRLLTPAMRSLLSQRDDWAFWMFGYTVLCVCREPFGAVDDVADRLRFLQSLGRAIPPELGSSEPVPTPQLTLPDGTPIDLTHPEQLKAAVERLTPDQQAQLLQQFQQLDPKLREQLLVQFVQPKH